jgi:hypothetical protein
LAKFRRDIFVDRAGVGLFFLNAQLRKLVEDLVGLDFQLPGQLVYPDLLHK